MRLILILIFASALGYPPLCLAQNREAGSVPPVREGRPGQEVFNHPLLKQARELGDSELNQWVREQMKAKGPDALIKDETFLAELKKRVETKTKTKDPVADAKTEIKTQASPSASNVTVTASASPAAATGTEPKVTPLGVKADAKTEAGVTAGCNCDQPQVPGPKQDVERGIDRGQMREALDFAKKDELREREERKPKRRARTDLDEEDEEDDRPRRQSRNAMAMASGGGPMMGGASLMGSSGNNMMQLMFMMSMMNSSMSSSLYSPLNFSSTRPYNYLSASVSPFNNTMNYASNSIYQSPFNGTSSLSFYRPMSSWTTTNSWPYTGTQGTMNSWMNYGLSRGY